MRVLDDRGQQAGGLVDHIGKQLAGSSPQQLSRHARAPDPAVGLVQIYSLVLGPKELNDIAVRNVVEQLDREYLQNSTAVFMSYGHVNRVSYA